MLTLILGASLRPGRASMIAMKKMLGLGIPFLAIGRENIHSGDIRISNEMKHHEKIHTVTLYLRPENQLEYYDYIIQLKPKRLIFNPGAENPELERMARKHGIKAMRACTLVMLSTGSYVDD